MTTREIVTALFMNASADVRVQVLTRLVLDLFVEVEALRGALHPGNRSVHPELGEAFFAGKTPYQRSFVNAAYTSHNAAGPSSPIEKVLAGFYPSRTDQAREGWRECSVLRQLGFSDEEVNQYVRAASEAETFT